MASALTTLPRRGPANSLTGPQPPCSLALLELLDTVVVGIADEDSPVRVNPDPLRLEELPVANPPAAPGGDVLADAVELLDPVVVAVDHVGIADRIGRDGEWVDELPVAGALAAPA